ncbi:DEAD/DEAH box helicase family protein [Trichomonas vaginalis G3]|uniref:DEAD/DEAH box helicase family protein n=1 Tax=Trichomonas vaginalis (strain ATCC PRA-98 / G3) TaxID=412133 RepID=A2EAD4_TRIV3|nr:RNA helicase family [Trichomonas vaginalis G3]EAY10361.1 DEAD/DEAH box helicase family protein [Trichomonas vaginalis G3]KAI5485356.1 RNA helicase family [Trichomonas vaginalis G3]|eukprot:XP_001322584.1 DEAD/DEAH box helicase family protein [Trichomonas vaginalis G3]
MSTFEALLEGPALKVATTMYRKPTPIQKEVIPVVLADHDVVAMSKTGSGKTASFLLPIVQKLNEHSTITGCRCLIITPSRELALQTGHYFQKYASQTNLKCAQIIGGEALPPQFESLTKNPDVIIATPGRLLQIIAETQYSLSRVQIIVIDEADLLFEQGLEPQMTAILKLLPEKHQSLLFSATVPSVLAEFTRINLSRATVIRIDQSKLPKTLTVNFLFVNPYYKPALLLQTVTEYRRSLVFVATRYHAEFLSAFLRDSNLKSAAIYGNMDQDERSSSLAAFSRGSLRCLVVTDVAARGLDIEGLEAVVNYDFPERPKVFLHRAGRSGRAGLKGEVVSFVTHDELPYYVGAREALQEEEPWTLRRVMQSEINDQLTIYEDAMKRNYDLTVLRQSMDNGEKKYVKSRKNAKPQWLTMAKEIIIEGGADSIEEKIRAWRPRETIFEQAPQNSKQAEVMQAFRSTTNNFIKSRFNTKETDEPPLDDDESDKEIQNDAEKVTEERVIEDKTNDSKPEVKKRKEHVSKKPKKEYKPVQSKFFLGYRPPDDDANSIRDGTASSLIDAVMDMAPDDREGFMKMKQQRQMYKKNIQSSTQQRLQRAMESKNATLIKAATSMLTGKSVKGEKYQEWVSMSKASIQAPGEEERVIKGSLRVPRSQRKVKSELKDARTIERERLIKQKHKLNDAGKHKEAKALNAKIFGYNKK